MAGQVTWLFPLAVVGGLVAFFRTRFRWTVSPAHQQLVLWGGLLATYYVVYSFSRGILMGTVYMARQT